MISGPQSSETPKIWAPSLQVASQYQQSVMLLPRAPKSREDAENLLADKLVRMLKAASQQELYWLEDNPDLAQQLRMVNDDPRQQARALLWSDSVALALQVWDAPPALNQEDLQAEYQEQTLGSLVEHLGSIWAP